MTPTPALTAWLPLFPLKAVLYPGGVLPLRIFETRYIDMLRECMKNDAPFGIVLIKSGQEVGAAAEPEQVGVLAHLIDWDMPELGLMMVRVRGGERFRIHETRVYPDQRLEALTEPIPPDPEVAPSDMHVQCARALKLVIDDMEARLRTSDEPDDATPFARPLRMDSASWVANRWCEILPIPLQARQKLLELEDPSMRLSLVHQYLTQHRII